MSLNSHHLDFHTGASHPSGAVVLPPAPSASFAGVSVLLASNSPRRRELLGLIMPSFEIAVPRDIDEVYPDNLPPEEVPLYLSALKAKAYADLLTPGELIITADTIVIAEGKIMGKPHDADEAVAMLKTLQNSTHTVVTGVTLLSLEGKKTDTFSETTHVSFGPLTDDEIRLYVERFQPFDKAGAYGIQEWIGAAAISRVDGCFYNVMGLPLHTLPSQLSGGQQQRVAIARALATKPHIVLADEPTGNLDSKTSLEVMLLLEKLNRELSQTIVMITHSEELAQMTARRIRIEDGRIISDSGEGSK